MSASEARIIANKANAQLSTGPKTDEGKARSRCNSFKHGLTGEGVVLPNEDLAEVERKVAGIQRELDPSTEIGQALARRVAMLAVRMDRCVAQETAALSGHVRQAEASFEAPAGLDEATVAQLRAEAGRKAMFDPSKEATLARKYEAAAERGFFRALKELREVEGNARLAAAGPQIAAAREALGSFLQDEAMLSMMERESMSPPRSQSATPSKAAKPEKPGLPPNWYPTGLSESTCDVPINVGRAG